MTLALFRVLQGIPPEWEVTPESSLRDVRGRAVLLIAAGTLLLASCGEDDESNPGASKSSERFHAKAAKFHRQGTAICHRAAREAAAFARAILRGEGDSALPRYLEIEERLNRRFAELDPPSRRAARLHRRAVRLNNTGHRMSERIYTRTQQGSSLLEAIAAESSKSRRLARRGDRLIERLGLPDCTSTEFEALVRGNI